MIVVCESCRAHYDDEFRLTTCPHDTFLANDGNNNLRHYPESFIARPMTEKELAEGLKAAGYHVSLRIRE